MRVCGNYWRRQLADPIDRPLAQDHVDRVVDRVCQRQNLQRTQKIKWTN